MIITNGKIITWGKPNQILDGKALHVADGKIVSIADGAVLLSQYPEDEVLDAGGQYIMPGNICAHTHFYGAFSRGMAIPGPAPANFVEILQSLWWKLDKALDTESIKYSALVCLVDAIKYGTTTLFDHHASPNYIEGSLDIIEEAVKEAGLRASLCYEVTDRDGEERALVGIRENERFIQKVARGETSPRIRAHFGLHASLTVSADTLERCLQANPNQVGFHVHAAEGQADQEDALRKYGKRVIERFYAAGVLGPRTILAHGVHTNAHEHELLAQTHTWLSHQPRSNMNNAVGVAPIPEMLARGVPVVMGNDGFSNAMWSEWQAAYFIHKDHSHDPRVMNGFEVLKIAVENNADLATQTFDGLRIGEICEGAAADLILVDFHPITPLTTGNLPWQILFGFRDGMVTATMVDGKLLMKDRRLLTLDEAEIAAKAREQAQKVWERIH
ncbi:MAG TPA: putative aminohydrolase SsnA [Anaerolineaceae bacterium]|nr:putative aminohydrolase SsnA [Anaerolineaceae bacterium]